MVRVVEQFGIGGAENDLDGSFLCPFEVVELCGGKFEVVYTYLVH